MKFKFEAFARDGIVPYNSLFSRNLSLVSKRKFHATFVTYNDRKPLLTGGTAPVRKLSEKSLSSH